MGLEYIQLFADMEALFEPYDDAQRGRLVMAMMAYAYRGEEPGFDGVEKFIWPVLKQHIDRCAANVEAKKAAGSKGGKRKNDEKQAEAEESNAKQNEAEVSKRKQMQADASESKQNAHNHDHDNDHEQEHDQEKKENNGARAREAASSAADDGKVIGIDGTDLSGAFADYDKADALVHRYKLPDTDQSREAILADAQRVGWEKVEKALSNAALGNSRPMLSVNFYRKVLESDGKPREQRASPGNAPQDKMLRYSEEERKATYSAAILDFDEVG